MLRQAGRVPVSSHFTPKSEIKGGPEPIGETSLTSLASWWEYCTDLFLIALVLRNFFYELTKLFTLRSVVVDESVPWDKDEWSKCLENDHKAPSKVLEAGWTRSRRPTESQNQIRRSKCRPTDAEGHLKAWVSKHVLLGALSDHARTEKDSGHYVGIGKWLSDNTNDLITRRF